MGKNKLTKFAEMEHFENVIQPQGNNLHKEKHEIFGTWHKIFGNDNPIVLELGCGKGDYTLGLARKYPEKNFIGIDIKGHRIYTGAKKALEENLKNVRFLRTRIDNLPAFFAPGEVEEMWQTFPDPQRKKQRQRLTSAKYLNLYKQVLIPDGLIHLKTDNPNLYQYTLLILEHNNIEPIIKTDDLYNSGITGDPVDIQTYYERMFLAEGKKITYIAFRLSPDKDYRELPEKFTWKKTSKYA